MKETLVVFFKSPDYGKVKTRLAASIGNDKAVQVYLHLLNYTVDICKEWKSIHRNRNVVFYGTGDKSFWKRLPYLKKQQHGRDLGLKMEQAIREELNFADKVVIIGTDCFDLKASNLVDAFDALNDNDSVFGPSEDGGFYLYGTKNLPINAFTSLSWSQSNTLEMTQRRIEGFHHKVNELITLRDIDTIEDLNIYPTLRLYAN